MLFGHHPIPRSRRSIDPRCGRPSPLVGACCCYTPPVLTALFQLPSAACERVCSPATRTSTHLPARCLRWPHPCWCAVLVTRLRTCMCPCHTAACVTLRRSAPGSCSAALTIHPLASGCSTRSARATYHHHQQQHRRCLLVGGSVCAPVTLPARVVATIRSMHAHPPLLFVRSVVSQLTALDRLPPSHPRTGTHRHAGSVIGTAFPFPHPCGGLNQQQNCQRNLSRNSAPKFKRASGLRITVCQRDVKRRKCCCYCCC